MELFCTQIKYTADAMKTIIKNKEDRSLAVRSTVESVGGKMLGFYGMLGQEYDAMVITQVPSKI